MAAPSGPVGGGGHIPFSAEWLKKAADAAKKSQTGETTETSGTKEQASLSDAAKGLAITKQEKMLQTMKAELSHLDPESETFMEEATEKLIDSVIDQEYGEGLKKKPGYGNLQEKLLETILTNEATRDAVGDFFELLLMVEEHPEEEEEFEDEEDEGESEEDEFEEEESYEED